MRIFRQIISFSFIGKSKKKPSSCSGFNMYSVAEYIVNQRELAGAVTWHTKNNVWFFNDNADALSSASSLVDQHDCLGIPASRDGAKEAVPGGSGCPITMPQTRASSNRCLFLPVPGAGRLWSGCPQSWILVSSLFLACRWPSYSVLTWHREGSGISSSSYRDTNPIVGPLGAPFSRLHPNLIISQSPTSKYIGS